MTNQRDKILDEVFDWFLNEDIDIVLDAVHAQKPTAFGLAIAEAVYPKYEEENNMCNCMNEILEDIKVRVTNEREITPDSNLEIRWSNTVVSLTGGASKILLPISLEYWKTRTNGEWYKNKTYDEIHIAPAYCPFCGEKYPTD